MGRSCDSMPGAAAQPGTLGKKRGKAKRAGRQHENAFSSELSPGWLMGPPLAAK